MSIALSGVDWFTLFAHFMSLSLLAIGGAITTAPDMHRFLVDQRGWLTDVQFTSSIALAQAAPGPNVLFVALMGWNVGLNAAGGIAAGGAAAWWTALGGALLAMLGTMIPSATLTYFVAQWGHRNRHRLPVRAFKAGMAPIVIALLIATGWLITSAHDEPARDWRLWLLTAVATVIVVRTRLHMLWLIGVGALLGALGWV